MSLMSFLLAPQLTFLSWKQQKWRSLLHHIDEFVVLLLRLFFLASKTGTSLFRNWIHGATDLDSKLVSLHIIKSGKKAGVRRHSHDADATSHVPGCPSSELLLNVRGETQGNKTLSSPGFSFSAAGLLFPYYIGASQCLMQHGFITETTPLAGASAGAIVCVAIAAEIPMHVVLKACKLMIQECKEKGTIFKLRDTVRVYLDRYLPEDAHIKASGRVRVGITQLFKSPMGLLVEHFSSRGDLINALLASSFIPGYVAARPFTLFRNSFCVDGGFTNFTPPTSAEKTVGVCAFQVHRFGLHEIEISPDLNPQSMVAPSQVLNWAVQPQNDSTLDTLFNLGYENASAWVQKKLLESNSTRTC
ncbi:hypothetical protein O6H91_14G047000 [Diphasiastrum complanatum]|uniref:Uncharacterized protein n=2 Tax=Diphasiastrum complanatum TaxID=34168 RepID=A0ACC2BPC9_DIPCM|nr:hypothetical protein O6H91_14G047000 [Diphasiastrum complanatum]KAJ7531518.1 hypothetical protein O6H91_14G047000 [Diphasiastrum complanatum]